MKLKGLSDAKVVSFIKNKFGFTIHFCKGS